MEQAWANVCRDYASKLGGTDARRLLKALLVSRDNYWADPARNQWGRNHPEEAHYETARAALAQLRLGGPSIASAMTAAYTSAFDESIAPFPGALEALSAAKNSGVKLALLTNGSGEVQRRKINKFSLDSVFDCIVVEGEFGVGKPDPRVFRHVLDRLGVAPADAWMAGDNLEHDVAPAQALGMTGIWVDWQEIGLPKGNGIRPDRIIQGLRELLA